MPFTANDNRYLADGVMASTQRQRQPYKNIFTQ